MTHHAVKPARLRVLDVAWRERGVHEIGFHNRGKRVDEYQHADELPGVGYAWCMAFLQWAYQQVAQPLPTLTASVGMFLAWARSAGWIVQKPARGDIVCFNFDADNWADHVGLVLNVYPLFIRTIEGNTSPDDHGSQTDGGGVYVRLRRKSQRYVYVRVPNKQKRKR